MKLSHENILIVRNDCKILGIFKDKDWKFGRGHQQRYWQDTTSNHFICPIKFPWNFITWKTSASYFLASRLIRRMFSSSRIKTFSNTLQELWKNKLCRSICIQIIQKILLINICSNWILITLTAILVKVWGNRIPERIINNRQEIQECELNMSNIRTRVEYILCFAIPRVLMTVHVYSRIVNIIRFQYSINNNMVVC